MGRFVLPPSKAHWLDRCREAIERLEEEHPGWWFVRSGAMGVVYYAFEPNVWEWDFWLAPNGANGAGSHHTEAGERYGRLTEHQLWEWLRVRRKEGVLGLIDWDRQAVYQASFLAYYDHLSRKHQYYVRDGRIKLRMARRIA